MNYSSSINPIKKLNYSHLSFFDNQYVHDYEYSFSVPYALKSSYNEIVTGEEHINKATFQVVNPSSENHFKNGFFESLLDLSVHKNPSGLLPPAIKFYSPGMVVFERPPCYQMVQIASAAARSVDDDTPTYSFRIPVPWQIYIVFYSEDYLCSSVHMYFKNSPLSDKQDSLFLPPLTNFFSSGRMCRPMYSDMSDIDRYSKDLSGVIASAYDWIWNSGANLDLTESCLQPIAQSIKNTFISDQTRDIYKNSMRSHHASWQYLESMFTDWENVSIENILNYDWPNPTLSDDGSEDYEYYFDNDISYEHSCGYGECEEEDTCFRSHDEIKSYSLIAQYNYGNSFYTNYRHTKSTIIKKFTLDLNNVTVIS